MVEEAKKFVYYKRNVPYTVGVRFHVMDSQGYILNKAQPWVAVPADRLRDFKLANRRALEEGLILEMGEEPNVDWVTPNALTEEQMDEMLKSYLKLKATLPELTSGGIVAKLLERAKEQNKSVKTISLIEARLEELSDVEIVGREEMRGVS